MYAKRCRGSVMHRRRSARRCASFPTRRLPKTCCAMPFVCWERGVREEFLDPSPTDDAEQIDEVGLRPRRLSEFVGQGELKEHLAIVLEAAKLRGQPADHLLLAGPPGAGEDRLARISAVAVGVQKNITVRAGLVRAGGLGAKLTKRG